MDSYVPHYVIKVFLWLTLTLLSFSPEQVLAQNQVEVCRNNLVLVIDRSGSIVVDGVGTYSNWVAVQNFISNLINGLEIGPDDTQVGVLMFSDTAERVFDIAELSKTEMISVTSNLTYDFNGGRTNTNAGLELAETMLEEYERENSQDVIILMTDGNATAELNADLDDTAERIKRNGARIIGIGITDAFSEAQIKGLVTDPDGDFFAIGRFEDLENRLDDILGSVCVTLTCDGDEVFSTCIYENCTRTCANPDPQPPQCVRDTCRSGCACPSNSSISLPGNRCGTISSCQTSCPGDKVQSDCVFANCESKTCNYPDPTCGNACFPSCVCPDGTLEFENDRCASIDECPAPTCQFDVILVVDESGSIWRDVGFNNWPTIRDFIIDIVGELQIGQTYTRVGMVMFGDDAREIFRLNTYFSEDQIIDAVNAINCRCEFGGFTNTTGGLRLVRQNLLTPAAGDRPNAENVLILVTDGNDNRENETLLQEVGRIKSLVSRVITIGVSQNIDEAELRQIATEPDHFFFAEDFDELAGLMDNLVQQTCAPVVLDPQCPAPPPRNHVTAFSAYITTNFISLNVNQTVVFNAVWTNINQRYNTQTGVFTCPCRGLYMFVHEWSAVSHGLSTGIVHNGWLKSPLAQVNAHGSMSTSTVIECDVGDRVYVQVFSVSIHGTVVCAYTSRSVTGFAGYLIAAL